MRVGIVLIGIHGHGRRSEILGEVDEGEISES
jgi:hypothetical protein